MQDNRPRKKFVKRTVLWAVIAVVFVLAAGAAGGTKGTLAAIGVIGIVTAAYAFFTKKPSWLNLRSRKSVAVVFIVSLLLFFVPSPGESATEASGDKSASSEESSGNATEPDSTDPDTTVVPEAPDANEIEGESDPEKSTPEEPTNDEPASDEPAVDEPAVEEPATEEPAFDEPATEENAAPGTALAALDTLEVKGRAPKTGYDRKKQFGNPWTDVEYNGCDTRNDILKRDLIDIEVDDRCRVLTGTLIDKFSGDEISFVRGQYTSSEVQIDHVVALSDAWQKGAQNMTREQRVVFANDPINLLAVSGRLNSQKSDSDAASWLPPHKPFRCEFVAIQVSVKVAYELWVTKGEKAAMKGVLENCDDEPIIESRYKDLMQANS